MTKITVRIEENDRAPLPANVDDTWKPLGVVAAVVVKRAIRAAGQK